MHMVVGFVSSLLFYRVHCMYDYLITNFCLIVGEHLGNLHSFCFYKQY